MNQYADIVLPESMDFMAMKPADARKYFDWYVSIEGERIGYLSKSFADDNGGSSLDGSERSLDALWKWLRTKIGVTRRSLEVAQGEVDALVAKYHDALLLHGINMATSAIEKTRQIFDVECDVLNIETRYIAFDVGFYFAGIVKGINPAAHWHLERSKKVVGYNQPSLSLVKSGKWNFSPYETAISSFRKILIDKNENNHLLHRLSKIKEEISYYPKPPNEL